MERLSRFVFGGQELITTISVMPWIPADMTIGGSRTSAAGVPASYVVRRDALLDVTLRVYESEWASVLNLVVYGQSAQALTWYPDAADAALSWLVYLESPAAGERFAPTRNGAFLRMFEVSLTFRGVGTVVPWADYFQVG